ncbi:MAG: aromatic ring-hydroxylating dioxygenase subunit alpha [Myxococcales bacterium]|nr:aromatic ring-hydroxylating dioxygenase subunit alpha [Myxococcales bacterium]
MSDPYPPRYPNGWFRAAFSHEVARGKLLPVKRFGRDLVVFRGEDGEARVFDAYCPHLGAHLGEGQVVGNRVRCAFHHWSFDSSGACVDVPGAKKIPPSARLRCWPVREVNGVIFVHVHAVPGTAPAYEPPEVSELSEPGWMPLLFRGRTIKTHLQETMENIVDLAHFPALHTGVLATGFRELPTVTRVEAEDTRFFVEWRTELKVFGRDAGSTVRITCHGPGFTVVRVSSVFEAAMIFVTSPVDDETIDFRFGVTVKKMSVPLAAHGMRQFLAYRVINEVHQDARIWETKTFLERPVFSSADGPIIKIRRWVSQFYPEVEPTTPTALSIGEHEHRPTAVAS